MYARILAYPGVRADDDGEGPLVLARRRIIVVSRSFDDGQQRIAGHGNHRGNQRDSPFDVAISSDVDGGAEVSAYGGVGLHDGFAPRVEVGGAEDICRAGDVVLCGGSNIIRFFSRWCR